MLCAIIFYSKRKMLDCVNAHIFYVHRFIFIFVCVRSESFTRHESLNFWWDSNKNIFKGIFSIWRKKNWESSTFCVRLHPPPAVFIQTASVNLFPINLFEMSKDVSNYLGGGLFNGFPRVSVFFLSSVFRCFFLW